MRATGIIRRIDDLGRVVVPREIRNSLKIKEGDALEIFVDRNMVCFQKYNAVAPLEEVLECVIELAKDEDVARAIPQEDRDLAIAVANMLLGKWKQSEESEDA